MSDEALPGPPLEPDDSTNHPLAPWFGFKRREHRLRRAAPRSRSSRRQQRRRAVVTIVHDEAIFLPIWLAYYSRFFAPADIYVLDNESTDGSTDRAGFQRIPVAHDRVDHRWMVQTVEDLQHELLETYDVVLVTDVDEIVAPAPRLGTLGDYIDRFDQEFVNCLGYELLHMRDREPPLQLDRPILAQRGFWFPNDAYDKAALATVPMSWRTGFHGRSDFQFNFDPDLRLIHLHRMDFDLCLERHRTRRRRAWNAQDVELGWAAHNRVVDDQEFTRWFYEDGGVPGITIAPEPIPETWRGVL